VEGKQLLDDLKDDFERAAPKKRKLRMIRFAGREGLADVAEKGNKRKESIYGGGR